ncbi:MAG TPA: hypothetical protein VF735_06605 [Pyrinomonadaceae bacterium]
MNGTQAIKRVQVIEPAAIVDNASITTTEIDTLGFEECDVHVRVGATDIGLTALKIQESDTSGSGYTDIDGLDYSTDGILPGASDDNKTYSFHIRLGNGRKRYLKLVATGGDGTAGSFVVAEAWLSNAKELPNSATERGLAAELYA